MEYETCWLNIICLAGIFEGVRQVHQQKISLAPGERVQAKLVTQNVFLLWLWLRFYGLRHGIYFTSKLWIVSFVVHSLLVLTLKGHRSDEQFSFLIALNFVISSENLVLYYGNIHTFAESRRLFRLIMNWYHEKKLYIDHFCELRGKQH